MQEPAPVSSTVGVAVPNSSDELLSQLYTELRHLAARRLAQERPGQTLQATALVHEAWLRLERERNRKWRSPQHFFSAAATAMRRILIENARRKNSPKHGGDLQRVNLEHVAPAELLTADELIAVDDALEDLAKEDSNAAQLVELRFFVGLRHQEAAEIMGITRREADGLWAYARAWLFEAVQKDVGANGPGFSP